MDGLLATSNGYDKEFIDPETVHPLLFLAGQDRIFKVAPSLAAMRLSLKLPMFKRFRQLIELLSED
jgi:hypothetical protein